jgi:hypothetical protein
LDLQLPVQSVHITTEVVSTPHDERLIVYLMVFNANFNNISIILWLSVLLVEETGGPGENHRPITSQ